MGWKLILIIKFKNEIDLGRRKISSNDVTIN